jgi:hypothetical protein
MEIKSDYTSRANVASLCCTQTPNYHSDNREFEREGKRSVYWCQRVNGND